MLREFLFVVQKFQILSTEALRQKAKIYFVRDFERSF